jgi:hypothetical protein
MDFPDGVYHQTFGVGYVFTLPLPSERVINYCYIIFSPVQIANLYLSPFFSSCRPEGGYVEVSIDELYEVERKWGHPFSMKRLPGQKIVYRKADDTHLNPRLKVVNVDEPDLDSISEQILKVFPMKKMSASEDEGMYVTSTNKLYYSIIL